MESAHYSEEFTGTLLSVLFQRAAVFHSLSLLAAIFLMLLDLTHLSNMLRASADPYLILRFQNWCGLRELDENGLPKEERNSNIQNGRHANGHIKNGFLNDNKKNGFLKNGLWEVNEAGEFIKDHASSAKKTQKYSYHPFWHALFIFGSTLGNEIFYITFFPFFFWNIDEFIARRMVFLWALLLYCGQSAKDMIQWPRPPCPPVIAVEKRYQWEYGMPSTHAMVGLLIPFSLVYYSYDRYQVFLLFLQLCSEYFESYWNILNTGIT